MTAPSPKPSLGGSLQSLETCSTLHSLQAAQQTRECLSKGLSWSKPLPGSSAGFGFFPEATLVSESLQLGSSEILLCVLSESDSQQSLTLLLTLGREGPSESGVRGFLKLFRVVYSLS